MKVMRLEETVVSYFGWVTHRLRENGEFVLMVVVGQPFVRLL